LIYTAAAGRNELIDHKEVYKALGAGKDAGFSGVLKLRGIPFTTTKAQVCVCDKYVILQNILSANLHIGIVVHMLH
jgi:hypothetical protein